MLALFIFRVAYGLSLEMTNPDSVQVYLLGLKFFTTGQWPFFGPDVIHTNTQIAGPLQALVVGIPLFLTREPEAPLVVLNVFSFAGLVVFGIYLARRFPLVPAWITCAWLLTCPWTLYYSTHVYNPSYLLSLSCFFFVAFLELMPSLTGNFVPPGVSFFLLGFSLAASSYFHLSWLLLVPFVLTAVLARAGERLLTPSQIGWLLMGAAVPLALLVPTLVKYGFASLFEALGSNAGVTSRNVVRSVTIVPHFLSFASFEPLRFLGLQPEVQMQLLRESPWLIPFAVAFGILGIVQPLVMLVALVRPTFLGLEGDPCRSIRTLVGGTLGLVWMTFWFTARAPISRNYFILCPVAFLTGYLTFGSLVRGPRAKRWAVGVLAAGVILHAGITAWRLRTDPWAGRRSPVVRAMEQGDYRILGERRPFARY